MKKINLLLLFILPSILTFGQELNKTTFDEKDGMDILYGHFTPDALSMDPFNEWYTPEYESYEVNKEVLNQINPDIISDLQVTVVMGTWCSDSQREVPRFLKIAEYLGLSEDQITLIAVDRNKEAEDIDLSKMDIELVPTFIFSIDGNEIGRIIESPEKSLEDDILSITSEI